MQFILQVDALVMAGVAGGKRMAMPSVEVARSLVAQPAPAPAEAAGGVETDREMATADELSHQLGRLIRVVERTRAASVHATVDGLEKSHYLLLGALVLTGPRRASALADVVHSDPSTVSRQIAALVRLGWVERRVDPADRRACMLAATEIGQERFTQSRQRHNAHLVRLLADWSQADREQLACLLDRFVTDFEKYRPQFLADHAGADRQRGETQ